MKLLGVQYGKHTGPDAANQHSITFTVDETNQQSMYEFMQKVKKGTEIILLAYITGEDDNEMNELITESDDATKSRLNKRMHAMITKIAKNKKMKTSEIKKILKKYLINNKCIIKSSAELDVKGYALAIYYLQSNFDI